MKKIIAIEGMPGAGKTTSIAVLKAYSQYACLDQLMLTNTELEALDNEQTSRAYLEAELGRTDNLRRLTYAGKSVILDRCYISTLAYAYARAMTRHGEPTAFKNIVGYFESIVHQIAMPDLLIRFDISLEKSLERRKAFSHLPQYYNWFNPAFLNSLKFFYEYKMNSYYAGPVRYIDSSDLSIDQMRKTFLRLIN